MISQSPKGIIELGNINVKCLIFKINEDSTSDILSTSIIKSEGMHNGVITNLNKATKTIRSCISIAENDAKISLKTINVIIEQPEFLCTKLSKDRKIDGSKIQKTDIEFLLKEAKKQVSYNDEKQSIIHIFNHNYIVDGKTFIEEPINVYADYLSHEMTFISMPKNNIKNINQAFNECDIEVERLISCTFALGAKLLNNNELQLGSVLINVDSEMLSLGMFKNLALVHSLTIPIGVNHISKDISKVCSLNISESENIRDKIDYSFQNNLKLFDKNNNLKDVYFSSSKFRKISKSLIYKIIKSRLDEIFEILKKQFIIAGFDPIAGTNVLLVGEGAHLYNLDKYCSEFFETNIKILSEGDLKDKRKYIDKNFAPCLGALKIIKDGWETEAIPKISNKYGKKRGFFNKLFGYGS